MVRAKMKVDSVESHTADPGGGGTVRLSPVIEGSEENRAFYRWTPGGNVILSTINPDALAQFTPGAEFYVDFTPAG